MTQANEFIDADFFTTKLYCSTTAKLMSYPLKGK